MSCARYSLGVVCARCNEASSSRMEGRAPRRAQAPEHCRRHDPTGMPRPAVLVRYVVRFASAAAQARASTRSFSGWPLWPFTQCHSTRCGAAAATSSCHSSAFLTGFLSDVRQPLRCQLWIQRVIPSRTYWLSVLSRTAHGRFNASRPLMAAISSIRLLVVSGSPPDSSRSLCPMRSNTPQPPGPGLPRHAPSVNISTSGSLIRDELSRQLENHALGVVIGFLLADLEARAERIDDFADEDFGGRRTGTDSHRFGLSEPVPVDVGGPFDQAR